MLDFYYCEQVRKIYADFSINKVKGIKEHYNDLFFYFSILKNGKNYIPKNEYIKLNKLLNFKLNNLFKTNRYKNFS